MNHLDPDMDMPGDDDRRGLGADGRASIFSGSGYPDAEPRRIGRFTVEYLLGRGGMGEVFKARDPENDRVVALKVLDVRGYEDQDTLRRFKRESEAAITLDHVNIARFYGTETDQAGHPVIVMEYIEGRGLDRLMEDDPEMPFSRILDYIIQTARGLDSACRRSIIHRDIKPENLVVNSDNIVKIIDFGLAKSLWDNTSLTSSGLVVGTPRYISPEQGMGRSVDHRSDIYSLGATLYEMVTGQTPFEGDTPLAIMMKHINAPLVPPYMVNPRVPADISDIVMRMMAKDPGGRYQDYESLVRDLESAKIHRLSKERRVPGSMSGMQTMVLPEGGTEPVYPGAGGSYLTEGLVNVDNIPAVEPPEPPSYARRILLTLAGLAVLGFAVLFLFKPVENESGTRSTLGQNIGAMLSRARHRLDPALTSAELVAQDQEKIDLTRARMEAVVSKLLHMGADATRDGVPTISELRAKGIVTPESTRDAWGNDFFITDSAGGAVLIAPGRDGIEKTADDFRLSLDGSKQVIPPVIEAKR